MSMKHTQRKDGNFIYHAWLVVDSTGGMRLTRQKTGIGTNERRCKLKVTVPQAVFLTPELSASVVFTGEPQEVCVSEMEAKVQDALEAADLEVIVHVEQTERE